jgi:histidinol dehydrogenase
MMKGKAETFIAAPVENHREREEGVPVYPVYSRRSGGLSVGINLFPDRKACSFDCPYCEVFPFSRKAAFSVEHMEQALENALSGARAANIPVRDIAFSGNGEPTLSPHFPGALEAAARVRGRHAPEAALVLITNGTGLLDDRIYGFLRDRARDSTALKIWLKLDAGTRDWYTRINRSAADYSALTGRIQRFITEAPADIQTMLCAINGSPPPPEEAAAWEKLASALAVSAPGRVRSFQLYGKARPAPEDPLAQALPAAYLEERAASLRRALEASGAPPIPVTVFP